MASQAEVDLIISTADALPELERDLERIIRTAENGAPELDIEATLNLQDSISNVVRDLGRVAEAAEAAGDEIELRAVLDQVDSLHEVQQSLRNLVRAAETGQDLDINLQAEADVLGSLPAIQAQLRNIVNISEANAPPIELEVEVDRDHEGERSAFRLGRAFSSILPSLGSLGAGLGKVGLAAGSAAPLLAGVVTSIEAIAPAAAVAVSGMLAIQLASGAVKLAMMGVEDAVSTAFDPDASPKELAEAMEKLAPNARSFVQELRGMRGEFKDLQQEVQDNFFDGFDDALISLKTNVLPQVSGALKNASVSLNRMVLGAAAAAIELGDNGTLQKALGGATKGLANLTKVPGQAVTALGQLGAAAAPAFDRVTKAAANSATKISDKISKAFDDGRLEKAIDRAIDVIAQLGRIAGNVFHGIGNILDTVNSGGEGLFSVMEKISRAFKDVTASKGFQDALRALSQTVGVLVDTGLKLLVQALGLLGPIFLALAPPVQRIIKLLGDSLGKIFEKLGPVLVKAAEAFGKLIGVLEPFITLATNILTAILPALNPLFETLGRIFEAIAPFAKQLAENIGAQLVPLLQALAEDVLPKILPPFAELAEKIFPILTKVLAELFPFLVSLGEALAELAVKLAPLIAAWIELQFQLAEKLMPILEPLGKLILFLVEGALSDLTSILTNVVIPIIEVLTLLLQGRFSEAWQKVQEIVREFSEKLVEHINDMADRIGERFRQMGQDLISKMREIRDDIVDRIRGMRDDMVELMQSLPDRARDALGDTGSALVQAGVDLILGFVNGIRSMIPDLEAIAERVGHIASEVVESVLGIKSPSTVMRDVGKNTMDGFLLGIADRIPDLRSQLQGVAGLAPTFALPNGQSLAMPNVNVGSPTVQVFLGNEQFNGHVDSRIAQSNKARDRLAVTGVRR